MSSNKALPTMEEVAEMLQRATEAVRTSSHLPTVQAVQDMSLEQLKRDPVLRAAFQRGWDACAATITRTLRTADQPPAKRAKPAATQGPKPQRPAPATTRAPPRATKPKVDRTPTSSTLPPPQKSHEEPSKRGQSTARGRSSTSRGSLSRQPVSGPRGTPGDRKTTTIAVDPPERPATSSAKQRKYERFLGIKERTKARKAEASQQFRLAKHPGPVPSATSSASPPAPVQEEPMEVDVQSPGTSATPEANLERTADGASGIDVDGAYLDTPCPSFLEGPELEEDPPFFHETPPSSPGHQ